MSTVCLAENIYKYIEYIEKKFIVHINAYLRNGLLKAFGIFREKIH